MTLMCQVCDSIYFIYACANMKPIRVYVETSSIVRALKHQPTYKNF
jgi:hypothetical protein